MVAVRDSRRMLLLLLSVPPSAAATAFAFCSASLIYSVFACSRATPGVPGGPCELLDTALGTAVLPPASRVGVALSGWGLLFSEARGESGFAPPGSCSGGSPSVVLPLLPQAHDGGRAPMPPSGGELEQLAPGAICICMLWRGGVCV